jgi:hypothetical protein
MAAIGSFLLGTRRAEQLRWWYEEAFAGVPAHHGGLRFGDVVLAIDERPDVLPVTPEPMRLSLAMRVPNLEATAARLDALGTVWHGPSMVADPDGNLVHLVVRRSRRRSGA